MMDFFSPPMLDRNEERRVGSIPTLPPVNTFPPTGFLTLRRRLKSIRAFSSVLLPFSLSQEEFRRLREWKAEGGPIDFEPP
jgi:hypothetical protein